MTGHTVSMMVLLVKSMDKSERGRHNDPNIKMTWSFGVIKPGVTGIGTYTADFQHIRISPIPRTRQSTLSISSNRL